MSRGSHVVRRATARVPPSLHSNRQACTRWSVTTRPPDINFAKLRFTNFTILSSFIIPSSNPATSPLLPAVFNSRQKHAYQTIYSEDTEFRQQNGEAESSVKVAEEDTTSVTTQLTTLTYADGSVAQVTLSQLPDLMVDDLISLNTPENVKPLDVLLQFSLPSPRLPPLPALPTKPLHLDKSDIKFGIKIGEGNYGEVYRGQMTDAQGRQETVAIKSLKAVGQTDDLKREFRIMQAYHLSPNTLQIPANHKSPHLHPYLSFFSPHLTNTKLSHLHPDSPFISQQVPGRHPTQQKLKHRNIVRLCGLVDSDEEDMYVVMEYLPMGSLKDYLKTHREHINNAMLLKFAVDIAEVRLSEWRERWEWESIGIRI
ncbi:Tyrosine-protein kinase CSK [Portunus trituberculatus]|uniref:Tyrosine-protein kinase CSK n=1 Tax=Portunus trituberculatus TaxID=210409 RepID=A0A5B7DA76_PORTR|nr:Tyrosine-protein kinase CSK [Portunus trituberculatus]